MPAKGQKTGKRSSNFQDKTGQKIGRWTVLGCLSGLGVRKVMWQCICDCGTISELCSSQLSGNRSSSCGCYRQERSIEARTLPREEAYFRRVLSRMKDSAQKRKILWDCSEIFIRGVYRKNCYYCGASPKNTIQSTGQNDLPKMGNWQGLDRKDSSIGYTDSNCVPCCFECNNMKRTLHHDDFVHKCRIIAERCDPTEVLKRHPLAAAEVLYHQKEEESAPETVEEAGL